MVFPILRENPRHAPTQKYFPQMKALSTSGMRLWLMTAMNV
jgi:hypothetical protein